MKFPPFAMASGEKKRPSPTGDAEDSDKRVKAGIETNDDNIDRMIDLQGEMEIAKVAEEEDFSMTADELEFNPATLSSSSGLSSSSSTSSPRAPPSVPAPPTLTLSNADVARWKRPAVDPSFDERTMPLAFMWTAVDLMSGDPLSCHPRGKKHDVPGSSTGPVPIIRLFGVNEAGNSIACFIHGFTPYLYCILPRGAVTGSSFEGTVRNVSIKRIGEIEMAKSKALKKNIR